MNRRLNPDLFTSNPEVSETASSSASMVVTRKLEGELKESRKRISHLESLVEVVQMQMKSLMETNEKRTHAFSKAMSDLEREYREQNLRQTRHMQVIENRLRDQNIVDGKIETMVDRFNTSLSQFENKISSLQKVINEKEMTLMSYRRIIEQIVDEVEKVKTQVSRQL